MSLLIFSTEANYILNTRTESNDESADEQRGVKNFRPCKFGPMTRVVAVHLVHMLLEMR